MHTASPASGTIEWAVSDGLVPYAEAVATMAERAERIAAGAAPELVWLLEHPSLYTAGTSAKPEELLAQTDLPVHQAGRGGRFTYHGPGQRVVYVMLDVRRRAGDVSAFMRALEAWIIDSLESLGVEGETRPDRVGVWVRRPDLGDGREDKIAAIGIRIRRWISLHGFSINVAPDLRHYAGIVPCGISDHGVTSLEDLGVAAAMDDLDRALRYSFESRFGPVHEAPAPVLEPAQPALGGDNGPQ